LPPGPRDRLRGPRGRGAQAHRTGRRAQEVAALAGLKGQDIDSRPRMGIRVFHCDDSEAFTRLVAFWLAEHDDVEHVGEAQTADAALAALPAVRADVVLLDTLGKPGDDTLLQAIRAASPGVKVIVYSGYVRLMHEGALG